MTGSVVAREIVEKYSNVDVTIVDLRNHIAGNLYDYYNEHGILVRKYGPHTFHTKSKKLFDYVCRYGEWIPYRLTCKAEINGISTPSPFNFKTVDDFFTGFENRKIKEVLREYAKEFITVTDALASDNLYVRKFASFLFENDYKLYTAKQWGLSPEEIDPSILARVPLRCSYSDGYFDDAYQVMPKTTYVDFIKNLIDHPAIHIELMVDAIEYLKLVGNSIEYDGNEIDCVVYTGALDELLYCEFDLLPYRSLKFEWKYSDIDSFQEAPVVAHPQAFDYIRITEFKKMTGQIANGTSYVVEYSMLHELGTNSEPYYPVINDNSRYVYQLYENRARNIRNLVLCGRLADFKYYNMDQALESALITARSDKLHDLLI